MGNFLFGTIFGVVVSTIGFAPAAKILDSAIYNVQKTTIQMTPVRLPPPSQ
jgi:hypothetical protein